MRYHLGLGGNLGDRGAVLRAAVGALRAEPGIEVAGVSGCYETEPLGETGQEPYWNVAAEIETDLGPLELLDRLKRIEDALGRVPSARWGPRKIDIDILLAGPLVLESQRLTLPHKEFRNRAFVLVPLAELSPGLVDPITKRTVAELAQAPGLEGQVMRKVNWNS